VSNSNDASGNSPIQQIQSQTIPDIPTTPTYSTLTNEPADVSNSNDAPKNSPIQQLDNLPSLPLTSQQNRPIHPHLYVDPNQIPWDNPDVISTQGTMDDAVKNAARMADEYSYIGEAKRIFMLEAAKEAGYKKRNELRDKAIVSTAVVDTIAAILVKEYLEEYNQEQSSQES
jgi:hypothetical protein